MEQSGPPVSFRKIAPILHGALVVSAIAAVGAVAVLRGGVPLALLPQARAMLTYGGFAAALVIAVAVFLLRQRMPGPERGSDLELWWRTNRARVVPIWALSEAAVILGAVLWLLTDSARVLIVLAGTGLFLLAAYRPSKFLETL